jgi:hypothetical protein
MPSARNTCALIGSFRRRGTARKSLDAGTGLRAWLPHARSASRTRSPRSNATVLDPERYGFRFRPPVETVAKWSDVPAFVDRRSLAASRVDLVDFPRPGAGWGLAKSVEQIPRAQRRSALGRGGGAFAHGGPLEREHMFPSVASAGYDPVCHAAHHLPVRPCSYPRAGGDARPACWGVEVRLQPMPSDGHRGPCHQAERPASKGSVVGIRPDQGVQRLEEHRGGWPAVCRCPGRRHHQAGDGPGVAARGLRAGVRGGRGRLWSGTLRPYRGQGRRAQGPPGRVPEAQTQRALPRQLPAPQQVGQRWSVRHSGR